MSTAIKKKLYMYIRGSMYMYDSRKVSSASFKKVLSELELAPHQTLIAAYIVLIGVNNHVKSHEDQSRI